MVGQRAKSEVVARRLQALKSPDTVVDRVSPPELSETARALAAGDHDPFWTVRRQLWTRFMVHDAASCARHYPHFQAPSDG